MSAMQIWKKRERVGTPYFGENGRCYGVIDGIVGWALVGFYKLPIAAMPISEAVWPQFAMQVFRVDAVSTFV